MNFNASKIDRIATRICATFPERWDENLQQTVPAGVIDYHKRNVYVYGRFIEDWDKLFQKYSNISPEARKNIRNFYRNALVAIKSKSTGNEITIKSIKRLPHNNICDFKECRINGKFIEGTKFSPRISFIEVNGTNDAVLLYITDKDDKHLNNEYVNTLKKRAVESLKNNDGVDGNSQRVYKTYVQN